MAWIRAGVPISLCAVAAIVALLGCRSATIYQVVDAPYRGARGASLASLSDAIDHACLAAGWKPRRVQPGRTLASFSRGRHYAEVVINFDTSAFSIQLVRSLYLNETETTIHENYNAWVRQLEERIVAETSLL